MIKCGLECEKDFHFMPGVAYILSLTIWLGVVGGADTARALRALVYISADSNKSILEIVLLGVLRQYYTLGITFLNASITASLQQRCTACQRFLCICCSRRQSRTERLSISLQFMHNCCIAYRNAVNAQLWKPPKGWYVNFDN